MAETTETREVDGLLFPARDQHFIENVRGYQRDRLDAATSYVRHHGTALEVGAHVGIHTLRLAEQFAHVVAFEPDPANFHCLQANCGHLPNVELVNAAVVAEPGEAWYLDRNPTNSGDSQLWADAAPDRTKVATWCIDTAMRGDFQRLDFIKLDCQGHELEALRGCWRHLAAFDPVVMVEDERRGKLRNHRNKPGVVLEWLAHHGMRQVGKAGADSYWVPGPGGFWPFTKYAELGDYHWAKGDKLRTLRDGVAEAVNKRSHTSVLDVGCGDGFLLSHLANGWGIERCPKAVEYARIRCPDQRVLHTGVHRIMEEHPAADVWFDAAVLCDTLEHLTLPEIAIDLLGQLGGVDLLKPTLYVVNPEPCGSKWHAQEWTRTELIEWFYGLGYRCTDAEEYRISSRNVKSLLVFEGIDE